ncbi:hypothetical protein MKW94_024599 [Papaver nudicaule]|uniref:Uncharacterized protein n=1 Tax=Papaver nudicaule TaxID=74823 RepID=A0AA41SGU3_PAPNU|nr:hypothetical protein [Papaver nudicaule]
MQTTDVEDFSASATLILFKSPVPPLRIPIPAGLSDDPSKGPFVLAFRDIPSWKSAFQACESKIIEQCQGGARIDCSINASSKCRPPWWRTLLGGAPMDLSEREQCEERDVSQPSNAKLLKSGACNLEVTNCRGSDILSSDVNIDYSKDESDVT